MSLVESLVETIRCETAKEFIATLRVTDDRWLQSEERETSWIFRGQGNANHDLIPSAWRRTLPGEENTIAQRLQYTFLGPLKDPIRQAIIAERPGYVAHERDVEEFEEAARQNPNLKVVLTQAIFEIIAVQYFVEYVDRLGQPIPRSGTLRFDADMAFDWQTVISEAVRGLKSTNWKGAPHYAIWPFKDQAVVVLARHHGIPSSLLDWTQKPLIAAFFAADDNVDVSKYHKPDLLAVWAIHKALLGGKQRLQQPRIFRSELGYLHAQDGVLTFDMDADYFYINQGRWPTILDAVETTPHSLNCPPIGKITLPTTEAKEVLRLLWAEGISRPHLMPTFDNITMTLKQHWPGF